jgi:hypothetical protein
MESMIWLKLAALVSINGFAAVCFSQSEPTKSPPFPDTPKNHWVYEGQGYLRSQGLLVGFPDGLGYKPLYETRMEFAVLFHTAGANLVADANYLKQSLDQIALDEPGSSQAVKDLDGFADGQSILTSPLFMKAVGYLEPGLKEFSPELHELGITGDVIHTPLIRFRAIMSTLTTPRPGSALVQFSDVPKGHWAASAVLDLRRAGLLQGFPDGELHG